MIPRVRIWTARYYMPGQRRPFAVVDVRGPTKLLAKMQTRRAASMAYDRGFNTERSNTARRTLSTR